MSRFFFAGIATALISGAIFASEPPLLQAVYEDRSAEALRLIEDGADVNQANDYGVAPLSAACQNGNAELVKLLLEAGAKPDTSLNGGETALMTAARTGKPEPVKLLLSHGAKVDSRDWEQQDALMWAAAEGHAEVVQLLLDAGADAERALKSGFTPMLFAARNGNREVVEVLIRHGVDPTLASTNDQKPNRGMPGETTPLRIAVENGHFETAVALLEAGADPDDQRSGHAPLHVLTWVRKPDRGDSESGMPPPAITGSMTTLEFARLLVEKYGAEVDLPLKDGSAGGPKFGTRGATPFLLACRTADLPYLKLLHELGADLTLTNQDGTTPLLAASGIGSLAPEEEAGVESEAIEVARWLLSLGAELDVVNRNKETVMHGAAYRNWPKMVELLAESGADIEIWNQKNKHQWTPLLIAQGFRPGNFKPSAATEEAIGNVMRAIGVEPPAAPVRPVVGKKEEYRP